AAPEAIRALSRALELIAGDDPQRYELLNLRRQTYDLLGDRAPEAADLAEMERLAVMSGNLKRQAEVAAEHTRSCLVTGAYERAVSLSMQSENLAKEADDITLQARSLSYRGNAAMFLGEYDDARAHLEQALDLANS